MVPESYYVGLSAILFTIGVVGVVIRRNPLVMFMSIELMLNAANLALVAFGRRVGNADGQAVVFFVMAVPPAGGGGGVAIIVAIFPLRPRPSGGHPRPEPRVPGGPLAQTMAGREGRLAPWPGAA